MPFETSRTLETLARIGRQIDELDPSIDATSLVTAASAACQERVITVALVGEYNSGKSSLLNLFLGGAVVPVGRFPETGSVCNVRRGREDAAHGRWADSARAIAPTLADLRSAIAITRGGRRTDIELPDCVEITVSDVDIPDGVVFSDTPGLNDDPRMTRLAFDAAAHAEVLIWVFHSRQFLSLEEASFLRALAGAGSPPLCLFVVNMFLEEDSPAEWAARCREDEPHYRSKLSGLVRELGIDVASVNRMGTSEQCSPLFVSARAGRRDVEPFGGAAFRTAIERIVDDSREQLLDGRWRRVVRACMRELTDAASPRAALARAQHERCEGAHAAYLADVAARDRFTAAIAKDVTAAIAEFTSGAAAAAATVSARISSGDLKRDNTYQTDLNRRLRALGRSVADNLTAQLHKTAGAYEQMAPPAAIGKTLRALFTAKPSVIKVPTAAVGADGPAGGAVAGAIAGSVVPIIGTVFGAIAGGIIGLIASSSDATEKDVKAVRKTITSASAAATTAIVRRERRIVTACMQVAATPLEAVQPPDAREKEAWQSVISAIAALESPEGVIRTAVNSPDRRRRRATPASGKRATRRPARRASRP